MIHLLSFRRKKATAFAAALLLLPAVAPASVALFRHVLPCILDITLQEGELAADFDHQTVWFKSSGIVRDLRAELSPSAIRFPEIVETTQSITFKTTGFAAKLSDGNVYTFYQDVQIDRIQYSYGLGGIPLLNAGWVSVHIVPSSTSPGDAALSYMNGTAPPAGPHRYLGAFYLAENTACSGTECSTTPDLPEGCLDYSVPSQCPSNYGRLVGVPLRKVNERYDYSVAPVLQPTEQTDLYIISSIPPHANRIRFHASEEMNFDVGFTQSVGPGSAWVARMRSDPIQVDTQGSSPTGLMIVGHEEDISFYE